MLNWKNLLFFSFLLAFLPFANAGLGDFNVTVRNELRTAVQDVNVEVACAGGLYVSLGLTDVNGKVNAAAPNPDANCDPTPVNLEDVNFRASKNGYVTVKDVNTNKDRNSLTTDNFYDFNTLKYAHRVNSDTSAATVRAGVNNTSCDQNGVTTSYFCPVVLADDNGTGSVARVSQNCHAENTTALTDRTANADAQQAYTLNLGPFVGGGAGCGPITDPEAIQDGNIQHAGKFFVYNIFITLAGIIGIIILVGVIVFVLRALGISIAL